jgi:Flp pilus assembly protein TadG
MKIFGHEDGANLVEFAISATLVFPVLFGIFYMCLAAFSYNFVAHAARDASRYAIVRGSSCFGLSDCNITPDQISAYVKGLGYPVNTNNLTTTTTWYSAGYSSAGSTVWTSCGAAQCNKPGNAVSVTVAYVLPLGIPFVPARLLNMQSTSQMVISE